MLADDAAQGARRRREREGQRQAGGTLRRDRELAFYGAEDLTPSEFYRKTDAVAARDAARLVVERVQPHVR